MNSDPVRQKESTKTTDQVHIARISHDDVSFQIVLPDAETDYIQRILASGETPYEPEMLVVMARRLQPGDLVLDVGANIGNHTLYLAAAGCRVYAFEPNLHLCDALNESIELNGFRGRLEVQTVALGAEDGVAHFTEEIAENLGAQSLEPGKGEIELKRIDSFEFDHPVRAVKIDVEGMEMDVLKGAKSLLLHDRPDLYIECQDEEAFRRVATWLADVKYSYWDTYNATPTHLFLAAERLTVEQHVEQSRLRVAQDRYKSISELRAVRKALHDANVKYRAANERISELKEQLANAESEKQIAEARAQELQEINAELHKDREKQIQSFSRELKLNRKAIEKEHAKFRDREEVLESRLERSHGNIRHLEQQITGLREKLGAVRTDKVAMESRVAELEAQVSRAGNGDADSLATKLNETARQLRQANDKYRRLTSKDIPALKHRISELSEERDRERDAARRAGEQRAKAEQRLAELRASLTFQLGYRLRMALTTPTGLIRLPLELARIGVQTVRFLASRGTKSNDSPTGSSVGQQKAKPIAVSLCRESLGAAHKDWKPPQRRDEDASPILLRADRPRRALKVACIMDDFTYHSFAPECHLQQITPQGWRQELEEFQPEVLIIESAWRGKDELWGSKVGHLSEEVVGIVTWCRDRGIPTAFWNKEDPVHFQTFLNTARLFDCVFTTDIDCIHRYKGALGHDRVYFLPFACQPTVNNPVELYHRKNAVSFAGAYYARYPQRTRDLDRFLDNLPGWRPVEIYDRNYGKDDPRYQFPEAYQPYIVGTLPFERIDQAYKGYQYAINLNSIKQSQSMFARRVFELLGSNTVTISNFSRGLRLMFGDLVLSTDSGAEAVRRLAELSKDPERREKLKLAALRKTLSEHTYAHRLDYMHARLTASEPKATLPAIAVVGRACSETEANLLLAAFRQQRYPRASLFLIAEQSVVSAPDLDEEGVHLLAASDVDNASLAEIVGDAAWIAGMVAEDYYGPNYLVDMALASTYSRAAVVGKSSYFRLRDGEPERMDHGEPYTPVAQLLARQSLIATDRIGQEKVRSWLQSLPKRRYRGSGAFLATDVYNYCRKAATVADRVTERVDDLTDLDTGIPLTEMQRTAETTPPAESAGDEPKLGPAELKDLFGERGSRHVTVMPDGDALRIRSTLSGGKHEYVYAVRDVERGELATGDELRGFLDTSPGLNVSLAILFLDAQGQRINHVIHQANRNFTTEMPPETAKFRLGLRVYQGGEAEIKAIVLAHRNLEPPFVLGRGRVLVLTNHYPSYDDLYRNGFVHTRVRAYQERGVKVDVYRLRKEQSVSWHEFQNVDVTTGSQETLRRMLASGRYRHVLVHFMDPNMWDVLKDFIDQIRVTVWVHGAEIHPWYRRKFNIETEEQEQKAREQSDARVAFWRGVLNPTPPKLHLVFVSRTFSEEVMEDLGFRLPDDQYSIIHNPIDTKLFQYRPKPPEQRKRILSIRPFASRQYANDQTVAAILELAKRPGFEELDFRIIGDGPLFEETVAPIRDFLNVTVERRFLTQPEIAALHRDYGVFLCPTRWDSQGVSRDEAMSSGLVPVTTCISAVPEFVDDECGVLAEPESPQSLADGVFPLVRDADRFKFLSTNAAGRVRTQSAVKKIVQQELQLLRPCQSEG